MSYEIHPDLDPYGAKKSRLVLLKDRLTKVQKEQAATRGVSLRFMYEEEIEDLMEKIDNLNQELVSPFS